MAQNRTLVLLYSHKKTEEVSPFCKLLRLKDKQLQMKMTQTRILLLVTSLIATSAIMAQTHGKEEQKTVELEEVTVKATPVIRKADRDLYVPTEETKKRSSDGLDMLKNMQIPTLTVNTVMNTIDRAGDGVEVRINGRKADVNQVRTISPATIVRVEYHENPGLRYGEAQAVLDFIVKNPQSGGSLQTRALQSMKNGFGDQTFNLKLNNGKSQFEANYYGHMRLDLPMYRENVETYQFPDGSSLNRIESPIGGNHDTYGAYSYLSYNYVNQDKTNFYASLYYNRLTSDEMSFDGILTMSDNSRSILIHDMERSPGTTPGINLYLDQKLAEGQMLVLGINAGYYIGHSIRDYNEVYLDDKTEVVNIETCINDRNLGLTAEGNYIKEWSKSKLTAGIGYSGHWNRSEYEYIDGLISKQREDRLSMFTEFQHRIGNKWNVSAGLNGTYSNTRIIGGSNNIETFRLRPRVTATYRIDDASQLRAIFNTHTSTPSLSQMSPVLQDIDGLQAQVGNPELKPYNQYRFTLQYNYNSKRVSGQVSAYYRRAPDAIMERRYWADNGKIVTTFANQSGITSWGVSLSPRVIVVPEWVTISGTLRFHRDYTRGMDYRHCIGSFDGSGNVQITHWNATLSAMYQKGSELLWGETLNKGETVNLIQLGYKWKGWNFDIGMLIPFGRYGQGSDGLNSNVKISRTVRTKSIERTPYIAISYNFDWGRKTRNTYKLIDSQSGVQQSASAGK